ncbi:MAG TPA: tetratricopeptide repeat protein, partial [Vicinamibacterales bacterium]|nr:tetratricopeptide repeat protein [Vicinamibacterales bacterium]
LAVSSLASLAACQAAAQNAPPKWADTLSTEIENPQIAGDSARLAAAVALASRVAIAYPKDGLILHYQGYALYRQGLFLARSHDASAIFQEAYDALAKSIAIKPIPESHMLMSSIDGQLISRNPTRAMELGMQSQSSINAAALSGPANPRVWLLRGQGAIFTPPEYGGGLDVAEEYLKRSIELFASDAPKPGEPSWGKAEAFAWLGQVYERKGDRAKAGEMYKKALDVSPNYGFARMLAAGLK